MKRLAVVFLAACSGTATGPSQQGTPDAAVSTQSVRFYEDVAPILRASCNRCHVEGGIAPFALVTYDDVVLQATMVKEMTETRQMPPDLVTADGSCQEWRGVSRLTDEEIATIGRWVTGGQTRGDPTKDPGPLAPAKTLEDANHTFDIGVDFTPDERLDDDYRCFVIDAPPGATDRFLTAFEVIPGDKRVVHHAILFGMESKRAEDRATALLPEDDRPGYTCFGGSRTGSDNWLAAWAPGVPATFYSEGTGVRVRAGRKLVLQVHYNLANGAFPDRTRVKLRLDDTVAKEAVNLPLAYTDLVLEPGKEYVEATYLIIIPPSIPRAQAWGVFPHMHTLGRTMRITRQRAGEKVCMMDVQRWDFHWQRFYEYASPLDVQPGDIVTITCGYDTRTRQLPVTWGEGTEDEMCLAGFYLTAL